MRGKAFLGGFSPQSLIGIVLSRCRCGFHGRTSVLTRGLNVNVVSWCAFSREVAHVRFFLGKNGKILRNRMVVNGWTHLEAANEISPATGSRPLNLGPRHTYILAANQ
jgi:hypothetical protein